MNSVEEYVDKIGRISSEYKQLSRDKALLDDDGEVSAEEIQERRTNIYKYIKRKAIKCDDIRIAIAVLEFSPKMFKYLPEQFRHNKEFFLNTIKELELPRMLKYSDEVIQSDLTCCLEAVRMEYRLINYVSPQLKQNQKLLDVYSWAREIKKLPKKLPDIDLSKYGPDDDDKYFYEKNIKNKIQSGELKHNSNPTSSEENEILEIPDLDGATLTVATIQEQSKEKSSTQREKKSLDQDLMDEETIAWDDENDEDDGISGKHIDDDDDELPPAKSKKEKKGFFAKLFG